MTLNLRANEACAPQPFLLWDTIWSSATVAGDWAVATADAARNAGGLTATAALATAVVLCLFTDRRCPPDHPLARYAGDDVRGWWGSAIDVRADLGETELGSLLWLLERAAILDRTRQYAVAMINDALHPLLAQGVVAVIAVDVVVRANGAGLDFSVDLSAHDGSLAYAARFAVIWKQVGP